MTLQEGRVRCCVQGFQSLLQPVDLLLLLRLLLSEGLRGHQALGLQALRELEQGAHLRLQALFVGVEVVQLGIEPHRFGGLVLDVLLLLGLLQLHVLHVLIESHLCGLLRGTHLTQSHGHVGLHILQAADDTSRRSLALPAGNLHAGILVEVAQRPEGAFHALHAFHGLRLLLSEQSFLILAQLRHSSLGLCEDRQLLLQVNHLLLEECRLRGGRVDLGAHAVHVCLLGGLLVAGLPHLLVAVGLLGCLGLEVLLHRGDHVGDHRLDLGEDVRGGAGLASQHGVHAPGEEHQLVVPELLAETADHANHLKVLEILAVADCRPVVNLRDLNEGQT
mmetsp:Transcript_22185/g.49979  ORF Transcript_22185/g.49979 Transcript_22185/m.49979 type:complete len:334 (+) Transcript_22185:112-1113(+)